MATNPAAILAQGQALVPNAGEQMLRDQMGRLQIQGAQLQMQAQQQALTQAKTAFQRQQSFGHDMETFTTNPTPTGLASLFGRYPEFAKPIQDAHSALDEGRRRTDLTQIGSVAAMASRGDFTGAAKLMETRVAADRAAGQDTASDEAILEHFRSSDPAQQKIGTAMAAIGLGGAVGPEQAAAFLKANGLSDEPYTLSQGQVRYGSDNQPIASVAPKPDYLIIPEGGKAVPVGPGGPQAGGTIQGNPSAPTGGGGQASGGSGRYATTTAGVVSNGKLDPIAFFNNVMSHYEGGYNAHDLNGSPVNFGINQGANPGVDVKNLTRDQAAQIFAAKYFGPSGAASLPPALAAVHADTYFMNEKKANEFLAQANGDPQKYMDLREAWLGRLEARHPEVKTAWDTRNADLRSVAAQLAGGASPAAPAPASGAQPGDPAGTLYGNPKPGYHLLTTDQAQAQGLDTAKRWQVGPDGQTTAVGDASVAPPGNPSKTGPEYLATVPGGMASQIRALAEGRLPLPSSFALSKPYWQRLLQATAQYDPSFDAATAKARQQAIQQFTGNGKAAQLVSSVNRVANHLQTLYDASEKLVGPDTGFGPLNSVLAYGGQRFQPQSLKAYNSALPLVGGELEKIARGGTGSLHGVEQIMSNLSPSESLSTRRQAIKTAIELIHGAIEPLQNQYNSAFQGSSARPNIPWVTPRSQQIYDKLAGENFSLGSDAPAQQPAAHTGLPAGAKLIGTNRQTGKPVYLLPNGDKVSPR